MSDDSIEDKIESMKSRKTDLANALLEGDGSTSLLDASEVRTLFDLGARATS